MKFQNLYITCIMKFVIEYQFHFLEIIETGSNCYRFGNLESCLWWKRSTKEVCSTFLTNIFSWTIFCVVEKQPSRGEQLYWNHTRHGCSPVNLLHLISRTTFLKNTSGRLLLVVDLKNWIPQTSKTLPSCHQKIVDQIDSVGDITSVNQLL